MSYLIARYWPHALIAVCLLAIAWVIGSGLYQWGYDTANVRAEKVIGEFAKAEAEAQERARAVEQRRVEELAEMAAKHEQELQDAQARTDRRVSELVAGTQRLRREIAAYATERLSRDSASAAELSEAAERGAELVGAAVGVGAQCDATQAALIEAYEALRRPAP